MEETPGNALKLNDEVLDTLRRCTVEFVGTFFLTTFIGLTSEVGVLGGLVPGLVLMALVFAGGHISLASYNPAITIALTLRPGLMSWISCLVYIVVELAAGACGALAAWGFGAEVIPPGDSDASVVAIFFAELMGTFGLTTVVLNAATSADYEGNSFFGLAIGGYIGAAALALGGVSGAVFNPAVAMLSLFAPVHSGMSVPSVAWVYFVAPPLAAVAATLLFRFVSPSDHAPREVLMHGPVDNPEHRTQSFHRARTRSQYRSLDENEMVSG